MNRFRAYATKNLSGTVAAPRSLHSCKLSHDFGSASPTPKPAQEQNNTIPVADIESDVRKLADLVQIVRATTERVERQVGVPVDDVDVYGRKLSGPLYRAIGFDVNAFQREADRRRKSASGEGEGVGEGVKVLERLREVQGEMGEVLARLEAVERVSGEERGQRGSWRGGRFLDLDAL